MRAPGFGHRRIQHLGDLAAFTGGTGHRRGGRADARRTCRREHFGTRAARDRAPPTRRRSSRAAARAEAVEARLSQIRAELARAAHDRDVEILQERIARLALDARRDPRRRADRGRAQGALPAHRGRAGGDPGGGLRGHRRRRRHRAAAQRARRSTRSRSRATTRAASRSCARVLGEPLYWIASNAGYDGQATIDQVRGDARRATASTRSPASSATCSRRA